MRSGPLRNGKEPIFATLFLPERISDKAVRLAFSNFGRQSGEDPPGCGLEELVPPKI